MHDSTLYRPMRTTKGALPEQVARHIIELIAEKRLGPDTRLPSLDELAGYLGVSRTAVREAIKLLDAWGVVTVKHGVGTFVAGPAGDVLTVPFRVSVERGEESIRNLLQVRETLEPGIAALAAANARSEHVAEMEEALHTMDQTLTTPDEYNRADMAFHVALAKATGNGLFLLVIYPVIHLFHDLFNLAHRVPGAAERGQAFHRIILEHIKGRNADKAREAMLAHIKQVWREVQPQLDEVGSTQLADSEKVPVD